MKNHILFVDDEPRVLETLRRLLWNQRAVWEMDFLDAPLADWDELQEIQFDVALSDVRMPGPLTLFRPRLAGSRTFIRAGDELPRGECP